MGEAERRSRETEQSDAMKRAKGTQLQEKNSNIWTHQRHAFVFGHKTEQKNQVFRLNVFLIVWHKYGCLCAAHFIALSSDSADGKRFANRLIDYFFVAIAVAAAALSYSMFAWLQPNSDRRRELCCSILDVLCIYKWSWIGSLPRLNCVFLVILRYSGYGSVVR